MSNIYLSAYFEHINLSNMFGASYLLHLQVFLFEILWWTRTYDFSSMDEDETSVLSILILWQQLQIQNKQLLKKAINNNDAWINSTQ